jgi:hypothetical protein
VEVHQARLLHLRNFAGQHLQLLFRNGEFAKPNCKPTSKLGNSRTIGFSNPANPLK